MADDEDEETTPRPERRRRGRDNPDHRLEREASDVRQFLRALKAHEADDAEEALHDLRSEIRAEILGSDSYVLVFVLTLIIVITIPLTEGNVPGQIAVIFLVLGTLLLAVRRSHMPRRTMRQVSVVAVIGAVLALTSQIVTSVTSDPTPALKAVTSLLFAFLLALSIPAMLRRVLLARKVTMNMLAGALAAYLLLGLFFSSFFAFIAATNHGVFFAQNPAPKLADFEYFSFITITTVGYGDLSPGNDAARAGAVAEAIIGQVFLVTIVARVVSHLGTERPPRDQMRAAISEQDSTESPSDDSS